MELYSITISDQPTNGVGESSSWYGSATQSWVGQSPNGTTSWTQRVGGDWGPDTTYSAYLYTSFAGTQTNYTTRTGTGVQALGVTYSTAGAYHASDPGGGQPIATWIADDVYTSPPNPPAPTVTLTVSSQYTIPTSTVGISSFTTASNVFTSWVCASTVMQSTNATQTTPTRATTGYSTALIPGTALVTSAVTTTVMTSSSATYVITAPNDAMFTYMNTLLYDDGAVDTWVFTQAGMGVLSDIGVPYRNDATLEPEITVSDVATSVVTYSQYQHQPSPSPDSTITGSQPAAVTYSSVGDEWGMTGVDSNGMPQWGVIGTMEIDIPSTVGTTYTIPTAQQLSLATSTFQTQTWLSVETLTSVKTYTNSVPGTYSTLYGCTLVTSQTQTTVPAGTGTFLTTWKGTEERRVLDNNGVLPATSYLSTATTYSISTGTSGWWQWKPLGMFMVDGDNQTINADVVVYGATGYGLATPWLGNGEVDKLSPVPAQGFCAFGTAGAPDAIYRDISVDIPQQFGHVTFHLYGMTASARPPVQGMGGITAFLTHTDSFTILADGLWTGCYATAQWAYSDEQASTTHKIEGDYAELSVSVPTSTVITSGTVATTSSTTISGQLTLLLDQEQPVSDLLGYYTVNNRNFWPNAMPMGGDALYDQIGSVTFQSGLYETFLGTSSGMITVNSSLTTEAGTDVTGCSQANWAQAVPANGMMRNLGVYGFTTPRWYQSSFY